MKTFNWRIPVGLVVVLFGVFGLLQTMGIVRMQGNWWMLVFALIFAAAGATFLYALFIDRRNWWAAIPGLTLVGLGAMMALLTIPGFPDIIAPFIFLLSIAAAFVVVYFFTRQWWAIIPAGVMASVSLTTLLAETNGALSGGVMFLGIAATFALLALVGVGKGSSLPWPWIPAGILFLFSGLIMMTGGGQLPGMVWAVLLICAGGFLLLRPSMYHRK